MSFGLHCRALPRFSKGLSLRNREPLVPRFKATATAASSSSSSSSPSSPGCDFLLGLAVRRHVTGYALLRFADFLPLQFGLIDVRKALEVQQKALEIAAVLRDLRQNAPLKLRRAAPEEFEREEERSSSERHRRRWSWVVSIDDSTVDRSTPSSLQQSAAQRAIAMLQGLVTGDCKRIFQSAPVLAHPRRSRQLLGVRGLGAEARKAVFEIATSKVMDFPTVRCKNNAFDEDTLLMSDAWAAARWAQRSALVAAKMEDESLVEDLRRRALSKKEIQRIQEAIQELHPRKASRELAEVLESRVARLVEHQLHQLLDEELAQLTAPRGSSPRADPGD